MTSIYEDVRRISKLLQKECTTYTSLKPVTSDRSPAIIESKL